MWDIYVYVYVYVYLSIYIYIYEAAVRILFCIGESWRIYSWLLDLLIAPGVPMKYVHHYKMDSLSTTPHIGVAERLWGKGALQLQINRYG